MDPEAALVEAMFARHGVSGPWQPLPSTGLANRIFERRFIHDDIHPMNIMCSAEGELLALIDWGDAGWGDPTLDFAGIPLEAVPSALEGYEAEAPGVLGAHPEARIAWNKLLDAVADRWDSPETPLDVDAVRRFLAGRARGRG